MRLNMSPENLLSFRCSFLWFPITEHVCCQSLSGCTVPQTQTGGCRRRSRSTKCSATPSVTLARAEQSARSCAAAAAAPAASTWTASITCRRTNCIWKAARTASRTEAGGGTEKTNAANVAVQQHIPKLWPYPVTLQSEEHIPSLSNTI